MNIDQNVHAFEERWIGRGTYGQVFELVGHQPPAVIKYIDCDTKEKLAAFKIEWETMKELNHTNLVPLIGTKIIEGFSFGTRRDKFGIIMEYCEGGTLKNLLQEKKMIYSMGTVLEWAQQLFDGLSYLFERHKLVHRDIKPDNVFVMGCMANYTLKFGDFGLVKVIEQTGTGSLGPTTRYTSPPQFDGTKAVPDQMKADPENSHRNDVYSLGLILWEIIERRIVYSAYNYEAIYDGQGCFNRDTFLIDIILKRFTKLESPQCQSDIQELVDRCTNFNRDHRPNAKEIFEEIQRIKSENLFISELDPLPRIEESQTKLLRPIGFDGQFERIAVEVDELSSFSSLSFSLSSSNRFSYGPFIEELTQKDASSALFEAKIVPLLLEKFLSLSDEQKENFYQNVPKIISRNVDKIHKFHEWEELYGKIQGNCTYSSPVKNSENIEELFELMIINDFYCLVECLYSFFNFLESSVKISLSPWSNYQESVKVLAKLEDFKRSRYTTRIYFKSYFSEATHETWFFIDEVHQELQRFVRKDLLNVMTFDGYRLNVREREILISGARGAAGYERLPEHDELHLTGLEPIDLFKVIEAMKKISENLVKMGEITMSKQVRCIGRCQEVRS
ncbi:unnamed protein product, partial [Mesorhabditis belari]|uniref:Protein kinase domain-containing protein n=1 Tax=Mesorhabditis belari TaxID=2138241 RepID=A0AAF3ENV4_9BILA